MKKILFAAIALVALGTTSCKKDWTCTCVDDTTGESTSIQIPNSRKPEASTACNAWEFAGETCTLN